MGLTLIERNLLFTSISSEDLKKIEEDDDYTPVNAIFVLPIDRFDQKPRRLTKDGGKLWAELTPSPDGRLLAAKYADSTGRRVALIDAATAKEVSNFPERSAAWSAAGKLVLFDNEVPAAEVEVKHTNELSRTELMKSGTFHGAGDPSNITGRVVSPDGTRIFR